MLAGALTACSASEDATEPSGNGYTQSGSVQTPDGQLMIAGPIASWPDGPTGMPQLPYSIFSADDTMIVRHSVAGRSKLDAVAAAMSVLAATC